MVNNESIIFSSMLFQSYMDSMLIVYNLINVNQTRRILFHIKSDVFIIFTLFVVKAAFTFDF